MADQTTTYLAESKFTGVNVLPEKLTIVGIDCPVDDMPDLADPDRMNLSVDDLVKSIAEHGVRQPVKIRKFHGDERVFVVSGRRRVRAAREVNAKLSDDCKVLVPCVPEDKAFDPLFSLAIENESRMDDTPLARARKAARMKARGATDETICNTFNISKSGLRIWWQALDTQPAVQRAVERGDVSLTVAAEISKYPPAEQSDALKRAVSDGKGAAALENVRAARRPRAAGTEAPRKMSAAKVKLFRASLATHEEIIPDQDVEHLRLAASLLDAMSGAGPAALEAYPALASRLGAVLQPDEATEVQS